MFGYRKAQPEKPVETVSPSLVGASGKLPCEADFIQVDAGWREVKALDAIVQTLYFKLPEATRQSAFRTLGVLQAADSDRQGLLAIVMPSQDSAGREYPFMVFNRVTDPEFSNKPDALFASATIRLDSLMSIPQSLRLDSSTLEIEELKQVGRVNDYAEVREARRLAMKMIEGIPLQEFVLSLAGTELDRQTELLSGLMALMAMLKARRLHRVYQGIWLPLPDEMTVAQSLAFWMQLLSALIADKSWCPDVMWVAQEHGGRCYVLTRPLTATAMEMALSSEHRNAQYLGWTDMARESLTNEDHRQSAEVWLKKKDASLLDLAIDWYQRI